MNVCKGEGSTSCRGFRNIIYIFTRVFQKARRASSEGCAKSTTQNGISSRALAVGKTVL